MNQFPCSSFWELHFQPPWPNLLPSRMPKIFPPNELISHVVSYLRNCDLKNARQVSRPWSGCAARFWFRKIHVSSQKEDLDVFEAISNHTSLSCCVKTLEYDAVGFSTDFTEDDYFQRLCEQTSRMMHIDCSSLSFWNPDCEINEFLEMCRSSPKSFLDQRAYWTMLKEYYKPFNFIADGYRDCMMLSEFQNTKLYEEFLQVLINGLRRLSQVDQVILDGE